MLVQGLGQKSVKGAERRSGPLTGRRRWAGGCAEGRLLSAARGAPGTPGCAKPSSATRSNQPLPRRLGVLVTVQQLFG